MNIRFLLSVTLLAVGTLLTTSNYIVKSQRVNHTKMPPFKFKQLPAPTKVIPDMTSAATSPGDLDPTFGTGGKLTSDFSSTDSANAVAVQPDGKIVVAGTARAGNSNFPTYDFAVFRYNPDGSLDPSFDSDGKVSTSLSNEFNNYDVAYSIAIQTDGRIIAAGSSGGSFSPRFALVRYNTDGSLDGSFGVGGKVITESGHGSISEIVIQSDGKIVATGYGFEIARYNPNGSLDVSFGTGGIVTTDFGRSIQRAFSVALQADGKIVAAGETGFCEDEANCFFDFALARYNTDGSLDTSFDSDGKVTTTFNVDYESATAVVVQTDGKIVAAGWGSGFAIARYNADGSLDASFDGDGKVTPNFGGLASSAVLQSDGKIVVAGETYVSPSNDFALVRLNTDGSLDTSFDTDGKVTTDFGDHEAAYDVAIQADGKIVAAGVANDDSTSDFGLSRYNADGSLDAAFDGDGKVASSLVVVSSVANCVALDERQGYNRRVIFAGYANNGASDDFAIATYSSSGGLVSFMTNSIGNLDDRANAAAIDPSGRIIAAGYSNNGSNTDFALLRPGDITFDGDGIVTTDFGGSNDEARAIAVLADYRIVVVGHTIINGSAALAMARYDHNGSLDASFGTGGKVVIQSVQNPKAMAIQPDGKIIAAGSAPHTDSPFGDNFALARFNPDGSLDTSFDGDGIAVTRFDFASQINAIALQPYGKIVVAGFTRNNTGSVSEFAVARYNPNGSLDTSFDQDGKVTTSFGTPSSVANAVAVQRNGKIVTVGVNLNTASSRDFAVARYNSNGSLDVTFDTDGKQTSDFYGNNDDAFAAAIQRGGNIIAAGSANHDSKSDFAAAGYVGDATQRTVNHDYDGDGLADISVFRPGNGVWYLNRSTQGFTATQWGISTDKIAPADYDRDGKTDIAVFRDGTWYLRTSFFASPDPIRFGLPDDIPVPGDYEDADGRAELVTYRGGDWWSLNLRNNQVSVVRFGLPTDRPVPADYDGDGRMDHAVYRNGEWHVNGSSQGYTVSLFGLSSDRPVVGDYDGDGKADLAVYRDGTWYVQQSTAGFTAFQWGLSTDTPAAADYDGDGKTDAAVYRDGTWYLLQSQSGVSIQQFGLMNDRPGPAAYVP